MGRDFPFSIEQVAIDILGLRIRHRTSRSIDVDCPFCGKIGEKRGKLNLDLVKDTFNCNYTEGHSGGMLDLYARYNRISTKEAYHEICDILHTGHTNDGRQVRKEKPVVEDIPQAPLLNSEERHKTYSALLSLLSLTPTHKRDLMERGLTEEQIEMFQFRSVPAFRYTRLASQLLDQGCALQGVPGFYINKNGEWTINFNPKCSGILIPIRTIQSQIIGFQIRIDRPIDGRKYIWLSSIGRNLGTSSGSPIHFVGDPNAESVGVTEGGLKGYVANGLSGKTFLCQAGVNKKKESLYWALKELKANGCLKLVGECNDMEKHMRLTCYGDYNEDCPSCEYRDVYFNSHECPRKKKKRDIIRMGCRKVKDVCSMLNLPCKSITWDVGPDKLWLGRVKGIDDHYLDIQKKI